MKFLFFGFVLLLFSCGTKPDDSQIKDSENLCKYSKWIRISETKDLVRIEIINPDDPSQVVQLQLPNFKSEKNKSYTYDIENPIQRMAVLSSTHIGMLGELNLIDRIVAVGDLKYVHNLRLKNKGPLELGEEQLISAEKIISSKAQVIIYNGFSNQFPKQELLHKLGIQTIPNYDWREVHPLGRAEWILLFGYLTGNADGAKKKFEEICTNYENIKNRIRSKKSILTLSGNMTGDYWYAPAGESYHAKLFDDAGLSYVFSNEKGTGSLSLSFEKILGITNHVDLWLNPGFQNKTEILKTHPKSRLLKPLKLSSVFCYSHNTNKYWELSACRPDLILLDYAEIKKGSQMDPDKLFFYQRVQ
ncbi:MAG: ABC transporter substrate-binding protein [Crocinitomicaceae bacterium]|nr:ABC transporter substrate-binding protein [Crocinitomicaceae bacterium]